MRTGRFFVALTAGALLSSTANAALTFQYDYSGNTPGVGFLDATSGVARQQALTTAGNLFASMFSNYFVGDTVLTFSITSTFDPLGSTLASAGSDGVASGMFGGGEVIRNKIINGVDLNGAANDGFVDVNWGAEWELDPNMPAVAGVSYDLFAALNHEFTHALGFGSNISPNGDIPSAFTMWDKFLTDQFGNRIVDPNNMTIDMVAFQDAQNEGGLFDGANASAAYGGAVPLVVDPDISHLNTDAFSPPSVPSPYMMVPTRETGPQEAREWSAVEIGILTDLGYVRVVNGAVPEPATWLLMIAGFGGIGLSMRSRTRNSRTAVRFASNAI